MPSSVEEVRATYAALSKECEALLLIEEVKLGRVHPSQIKERLHPWLPTTAESPQDGSIQSNTMEPDSPSGPSTKTEA